MPNPSKPLTAKQHFVPQFYLRNFANSSNELCIYDAEERRVMKPRGSSGICHDQFFYAVETGTPDEISQEIEDYFSSQVEDPLSKELPKIIQKIEHNKQITDDDKYTLALFMNNMWLRNPAMRKMLNDLEEKFIKSANKMRYSHSSIDKRIDEISKKEGISLTDNERAAFKKMVTDEEYEVRLSNKVHLQFMLNTEHMRGFANLFFGQHWIIHISKCDRRFVTSDNPLTVVFPEKKTWFGPTFLERTHIFPLTPTIAIEAVYPLKDKGKKVVRKTHFKGDEKSIDRINLKMATYANKYIYSSRPDEIAWFQSYAENIQRMQRENLKKIVQLTYLQQKN